ncbi:MAG: hypothetical protein R2751_09070 [Bacteroidales bacterium]
MNDSRPPACPCFPSRFGASVFLRFLILLGSTLLPACLRDLPETLPGDWLWEGELAFPLTEEEFGLNVESGVDSILLEIDSLSGFPLWASRQTVIMEGRIPFSLESLHATQGDIRELMFRFNFYNEFPNPLAVQAYFIDPYRSVIDSVFSDGWLTLPPGTVGDSGEILEAYHTVKDAHFDQNRLMDLQPAEEILFRAVLANPQVDLPMVPHYPDFRVHVRTGVLIRLSLNS